MSAHLKHGLSKTQYYRNYYGMMGRCYNENMPCYKNWGGRGIKVCERWHTFENFLEDMGIPPEGYTLERIDNDRDYCPENCKWIPFNEQAKNKRQTKRFTFNGETMCISDWAERYGLTWRQLYFRLSEGWDFERALKEPVDFYRKKNLLKNVDSCFEPA